MKGRGVLCSGATVFDIVARPVEEVRWGGTRLVDSIEYHIGGNGANTSIALAALEVPVRLISSVGRDDQGRFALDRLHEAGVDTSAVLRVEEPTAATLVLVKQSGDRGFLHREGASTACFRSPIEFTPALLQGVGCYLLASLFILPEFRRYAPETLRRGRAAGLVTALDTNWDPQGRWMEDLAACLPELDMLFMNEDEARMITGAPDPQGAAACVRQRGVGTAVIKLGGRGCAIYTSSGEIRCPAFDVEVKDTTGAGDCFVAGFLAAFVRSEGLEQAGRLGNAMGALSVQRIGAGTGVRSRFEVERWIHSATVRSGI